MSMITSTLWTQLIRKEESKINCGIMCFPFFMTKWASNAPKILSEIPTKEHASEVKISSIWVPAASHYDVIEEKTKDKRERKKFMTS